jgi:bacteriocin biosynthesis cyclodehydratase domain-containing protein
MIDASETTNSSQTPSPSETPSASELFHIAKGILRPRYRPQSPLLWREPGRLQVGEGTHHVILSGVTTQMAAWLVGLDGLRTLDQVVAELPIPAPQAARMLRAAVAAVAVEDAAGMPDAWRWVGIADRDATSGDRQAAGNTYGSMHRADLAIDRRLTTSWWVRGRGIIADQVRLALAVAGMPEARKASAADLIVLADPQHPVAFDDPGIQAPHLPIGVYGDRAIVGPLVVPGQTSCLQCAYLHTRDADPCWPSLSLQLSRSLSRLADHPVDRLHALTAAAVAALLIRDWVDQPEGRTWRNRAIEIRLPEGRRTDHERPPHPVCSCAWNLRTSAAGVFG